MTLFEDGFTEGVGSSSHNRMLIRHLTDDNDTFNRRAFWEQ